MARSKLRTSPVKADLPLPADSGRGADPSLRRWPWTRALTALFGRRVVEAPAAPAPAPVVIPARRAQGPALRVHLCAVCANEPVRVPGDTCRACLDVILPAVLPAREA